MCFTARMEVIVLKLVCVRTIRRALRWRNATRTQGFARNRMFAQLGLSN